MKKNGAKNGHKANGQFDRGNTQGGGKPGRSGRKPVALKQSEGETYAETLARVAGYLCGNTGPSDSTWRWCAEWIARRVPVPQQVSHEHSGTVEHIHEAAQAFESRMDRLAARLGTAAMPEWPQR